MQQAVQVLVDEPAIDREFTYLLPPEMASGRVPVTVGTVVGVPLHGRSIRGWVTDLDPPRPQGVDLLAVKRVSSIGPPPHVVDLAKWAAWRWAGTWAHFMRTASADRVVAGLPPEPAQRPAVGPARSSAMPGSVSTPDWVRAAYSDDSPAPAAVRLGPCADEWPLVVEALRHGRSLVLVPAVAWAARLTGRLRQAGFSTALAPRDWAQAASAHAVVGTRAGVWAPCGKLDAVLVLDEHDEVYQSEAAPTWNARDVAVERARRDGAHCLLVGPMPSPDALVACRRDAATQPAAPATAPASDRPVGAPVIRAPRPAERDSWPRVQVADRRHDDPATGEWCGGDLAELLRSDAVVVCVLNRAGRARLAYCASCGELAVSQQGGRALRLDSQQFTDPGSGETRPAVCESCGATRFRRARVGVKGVAEEMERLARRPVIQVVGAAGAGAGGRTSGAEAHKEPPGRAGGRAGDGRGSHRGKPPLYIGTEAVLHRVHAADAVVFVDFDQELMAPRYRAAEEAFALLVRAARLVGPRSSGGRILVQTRLGSHPALEAAVRADPGDWVRAEAERRSVMRQPPAAAWALVSGHAAAACVERLVADSHAGALDIDGPAADGVWRIRSDDRRLLLDVLQRIGRPSGRLRVAVDPMRA